jgi:oxygen-dependent protoporphyrinogen oxidase
MSLDWSTSYMLTHAEARHVAIIGGGIAGLSAAWAIQQSGATVGYTLLEAGERWGGKIATDHIHGYGDAPFVVECGPDALLTRKPWAYKLAQELGLGDSILPVNTSTRGTYVLWNGDLIPLPDGMPLLVPTKFGPFLRSRLFSPAGKLRMLLEPFIPARHEDGDESVGAFVRRRLGREALERLADPLLGGIYNADVDAQSLWATFPQFGKLEETHGSLLRGARARRPDAKPTPLPAFFSFPGGLQTLVDTMVERLTGDLRLSCAVQSIEAYEGRYRLVMQNGETIAADAVILATPAPVAGRLLAKVATESAQQLAAMRSSSIGTLSLGYRRADVPHPMDGHGIVIPRMAGRRIDGISWSSSKWEGRAPQGYALIRVFFGGAHSTATMSLNDEAVLSVVREELADLMGITAEPVFHHIQRWQDAYPEYAVGHLDRIAEIEKQLPREVLLAGSAYRGIGVPDCINQGQRAAANALTHLNSLITE